ncbi:MAG: hypothetical protein V2J07_02890 [Anaerolineae bacterium]|jgi:hypothetical protein|nr:hypothetical protein [Anaerolineae bacterium]
MALFPVPSDQELSSSAGWDRVDKRTYAVTRYHFGYREVQAERKTYLGEILDAYKTPAEIHLISEEGVEITVREQKVEEVGRQLILNEGIVAELSAGIKAGLLDLGASVHTTVQQEISKQLSVSQTTTSVSGVKRKVTLKKKISIDQGTIDQTFVSVQGYTRKKVELWLRFLDYLTVELKGKRRYKHPVLRENEHINRIKLNLPVAQFEYYESLDNLNSVLILSEQDYQQAENVLTDPTAVQVYRPEFNCPPARLPSFRTYTTLYQLADIAFPLAGWRK